MAGIGNQMKLALLKGMEAIGKSASGMANNAQQKLAEINLETRRREILSEFPMRAFDLWQKGTELPAPLGGMLAELSDLDERLSVLRAQRYAKVESKEQPENADTSSAESADAEQDVPPAEEACAQESPDGDAPVKEQEPESDEERPAFGEPSPAEQATPEQHNGDNA